jgi:hypothetical protein
MKHHQQQNRPSSLAAGDLRNNRSDGDNVDIIQCHVRSSPQTNI